MKLILDKACNKYGAQMGRHNKLPVDVNAPIKLYMQKLKMVDSDYDEFGAYWGCGWGVNHIYCAFLPIMKQGITLKASNPADNGVFEFYTGENSVEVFVRASDRESAKDSVRQFLINARFYN